MRMNNFCSLNVPVNTGIYCTFSDPATLALLTVEAGLVTMFWHLWGTIDYPTEEEENQDQ